MIKWARPFRFERCTARLEPNVSGFWGRCELRRMHRGDHMLERGMVIVVRWSTLKYLMLDNRWTVESELREESDD